MRFLRFLVRRPGRWSMRLRGRATRTSAHGDPTRATHQRQTENETYTTCFSEFCRLWRAVGDDLENELVAVHLRSRTNGPMSKGWCREWDSCRYSASRVKPEDGSLRQRSEASLAGCLGRFPQLGAWAFSAQKAMKAGEQLSTRAHPCDMSVAIRPHASRYPSSDLRPLSQHQSARVVRRW